MPQLENFTVDIVAFGPQVTWIAWDYIFEYPGAPLYVPEDRSLVAAAFNPGATFLSHISLVLPDEVAGLAL